MPTIDIPEFGDLEEFLAAAPSIEAAQTAIEEAWLALSVLAIADIMERFPALGAIGVEAGAAFRDKQAAHPSRVLAGGRIQETHGRRNKRPFSDLNFDHRSRIWNSDKMNQLAHAEKAFEAWAGDPRFIPFTAALAHADRHGHALAWIDRGEDSNMAKTLCVGIERPDLWTRIERAQLAKLAGSADRAPSKGPPRV